MQLYRKTKKGKYKKIGVADEWKGFPTDGFWLVKTKPGNKSSECIIKVDELDNLHPTADLIHEYKDEIVKYLSDNKHVYLDGISYNKLVVDMIKSFALKKTLQEVEQEIIEGLFHVSKTDLTLSGERLDESILNSILKENKHILQIKSIEFFYNKYL